ncbi:MAG: sulfite exporter TauE/SafE family protein [Chloroflexi bacterium]|nr:sulfite exporter TauE/SafE family protein [Chloroflexota bacterium]
MTFALIAAIVFASCFTQSLTGFGSALVAMALLPGLVGIQVAAPLVAVMSITLEAIYLARHHASLSVKAIWRLVIASLAGIPIGILALRRMDEGLILGILGAVIAGYSLYALLDIRLPALRQPLWAYLFGFLGGMLGGAYNTSGPPVVIYANCRNWPPAEFKSNLQAFFFINGVLVVIGHFLGGGMTAEVGRAYLAGLPGILLGVFAGTALDRYISPERFRKVVQVLLLVMGLRLMF